jgi:DNA-binding MarR family transcriptional regulator
MSQRSLHTRAIAATLKAIEDGKHPVIAVRKLLIESLEDRQQQALTLITMGIVTTSEDLADALHIKRNDAAMILSQLYRLNLVTRNREKDKAFVYQFRSPLLTSKQK